MSDTVPNSDIEDVLSSIRKLVSYEGGSKPQDSSASDREGEPHVQAPKLVLTPALRVEDDQASSHSEAKTATETTLSETEEALDLIAPDVPLAFTSARAARAKADEVQETLVLDQPVSTAATGAAQDVASEEQETDLVAQDEQETAEELSEYRHQPVEEAEGHANSDPVQPDDMGDAVDDLQTSHQSLTAKIAALEEVIGREPDQWEPESEGLGENAGTDVDALPWEDHVQADNAPDPAVKPEEAAPVEPVAQSVQETVDATDDTDPALSDMEDTILDEAMLRDLVSTIVREELQGALGERITRNVRKLVRREIHRAMSAQDFN